MVNKKKGKRKREIIEGRIINKWRKRIEQRIKTDTVTTQGQKKNNGGKEVIEK